MYNFLWQQPNLAQSNPYYYLYSPEMYISTAPTYYIFPANINQQQNNCFSMPNQAPVKNEPLPIQEQAIQEHIEINGQTQRPSQTVQPRKQIEGRNIHSNIFRSFLKYLNSFKIIDDFKAIKSLYNLRISLKQFEEHINKISKKFSCYVKKKEINRFITSLMVEDQVHKESNQILRTLLMKYCKNDHIFFAFHSRKMQKKSRKIHLSQLRKIRAQIYYEAKQLSTYRYSSK